MIEDSTNVVAIGTMKIDRFESEGVVSLLVSAGYLVAKERNLDAQNEYTILKFTQQSKKR